MASHPLRRAYSFERNDEVTLQSRRNEQSEQNNYIPTNFPISPSPQGSLPAQQLGNIGSSPPRFHPGSHPDSSFNRLQAGRRYSREIAADGQQIYYGTPSSPTYHDDYDQEHYHFPAQSRSPALPQ